MKKIVLFCFLCFTALALMNSCLGVAADISIRSDGSGKIALEYRVSQMLESLGRLDGNENWPAIPVGRADFQRSLARIPGLRLSSFSAKDVPHSSGGRDLLTKAVLEFNNTAALLAFLDSAGSHASLVQENKSSQASNVLRLVLLDPSDGLVNADLRSLLREVSAGYEFSISVSVPKNAVLSVTPSSLPAARMVSRGKKVSFALDMGELLELNEGLTLEITW
ncbi:MAG: hypothetical protein LBH20_01835 [Treponema sp.]|jgi:hypothetical protein|nr:hypothetical protein [Treponema sp.]